MKSNFKKFVVVIAATLTLTACAQDGFSPSSIAYKQVEMPTDLVPEAAHDLAQLLPEESNEARTMGLRDKVLMKSDISVRALDNALKFYDNNLKKIKKSTYITIFDISKHSSLKRLYVINLNDGTVVSMHVSHGQNSDRDHDGFATSFSNASGSYQSSLGYKVTAETYQGRNGYSLRLDGLESRNSNVRRRAVVVHGADYVKPGLAKMGRSQGCPAVSRANNKWLIDTIKGGTLFYTFHPSHD